MKTTYPTDPPPNDDAKAHERLQWALKQAGLSQAELARRVGMTRNQISQRVRGDVQIRMEEVRTFARALN